MLRAALIAKTWKQFQRPSTGEWINKLCYNQSKWILFSKKKGWITHTCNNMGESILCWVKTARSKTGCILHDSIYIKFKKMQTSLVVQWIRILLSAQGTRVQPLVQEDTTCCGATKPVCHNYWARVPRARALQQEKPLQWKALTSQWRVAPACRNWRKPSHNNEDPVQCSQKFL